MAYRLSANGIYWYPDNQKSIFCWVRIEYRYQEINIMIIKVQKLVGQSGNSMVEGEYSENFHGNVFGVYYTTFNMKSQ